MAYGIGAGAPGEQRDIVPDADWTDPDVPHSPAAHHRRNRRGMAFLNRSPLARKMITFNLLAILILVAGVMYLNPFRDSLVSQRERALVVEAGLMADAVGARLGDVRTAPPPRAFDPPAIQASLRLTSANQVFVFSPNATLLTAAAGAVRADLPDRGVDDRRNIITGFLNGLWDVMSALFAGAADPSASVSPTDQARSLVAAAVQRGIQIDTAIDAAGSTIFAAAAPITVDGRVIGVITLTSASGEIDHLVRDEREQVLQIFVIALFISVGLSLVLASTIANPLSDLAAAAEIGLGKDSRTVKPGRVRIPDLTARPDEIGRLSGALRGMVTALYDRIDANEQFAADVAHEIKNPLASLRSAVGSLRFVSKEDQRARLQDVIDHDVRRLDRLVSDISNASRLDSELVREEEERFDLLHMLRNLTDHLSLEARSKRIDFIADLPAEPIFIDGLESRLAQVFVNLITNAVSFCDTGDAIRVWVRQRENRVLVVVEDTGPGIPVQALTRIFERFYSERPESQFGNNSGLGLAISKQIVEAHGGVIWAENIRPSGADPTSDLLGARFVVGLPV